MTIEENLILLQNTKEAIYTAIESMGGTISSSTPFSGYADAIMSIPRSEPDPCVEDPCSSPDCPGYDAETCGGGESIPEGLWKFNVTQEGGTNVIWVEGFMTKDKSNTLQETVVNIYDEDQDLNGEPINSITYSYNSKLSDEEVSQTNSSAGLYAEQHSAFDTSNDPIVLGLSCNNAGYYYIEVVNHANPRFYDNTMTQIYPDNYVNS